MSKKSALTRDMFPHPTITGDTVDRLTIAESDETAFYSNEFTYNRYFMDTLGTFGAAVELDGSAADTMLVRIEFHYGGTTTWGVKYIDLATAQGCSANEYYRVDIQTGFRDYIPFDKIRFKFQKTGTNDACIIKSRFTRA